MAAYDPLPGSAQQPGLGKLAQCEILPRMSPRVRIFLLLAAIVISATPACERRPGVDAEQGSQDPAVVLRRGNGGDPETLDPARAEDVHAFRVLLDLYEGLVVVGADGGIIPGVAKSWDVSSDGLTYTFHLRPDARWSNGESVSAGHFLAGLQRTLSPGTNSAYGFLLAPLKNASQILQGAVSPSALGVSAPDDATLVVEVQSPTPYLLSILAMPIASPLWNSGELDVEQFSEPGKFVGNGAFMLDNWRPGSFIRLRRNPEFREAEKVAIDFVEYYAIHEPLSELNMYRAGQLDITATVPGSHVKNLRSSRAAELHIAPSLAIYYLAFDLSEAPFDNPILRKALTMAIDREALVNTIGRGERPAYGLVPDGMEGYQASRFDWRTLPPQRRNAQARQLYEQAGYSLAEPLQLTLTFDAGDIHEKIALAVSSMWRDVLRVNVELDKREWKYFLATRDNREDWQVMRFAWSGDYNHPSTFTEILQSSSPQNLPGYVNAHYDELLSAAGAAMDTNEQMRLLAQAERVMLADNPIAPLYFYVSKHLVAPSVTGFERNVLDQHPSRFMTKTAAPPAN